MYIVAVRTHERIGFRALYTGVYGANYGAKKLKILSRLPYQNANTGKIGIFPLLLIGAILKLLNRFISIITQYL